MSTIRSFRIQKWPFRKHSVWKEKRFTSKCEWFSFIFCQSFIFHCNTLSREKYSLNHFIEKERQFRFKSQWYNSHLIICTLRSWDWFLYEVSFTKYSKSNALILQNITFDDTSECNNHINIRPIKGEILNLNNDITDWFFSDWLILQREMIVLITQNSSAAAQ